MDGRSDVFSLGVVLYEMLTGCTPFTGDNLSTILYDIMNYEPAPPSSVNPDVPHAFDHIVMRALSKRPVDRYQTARDMATDLRALRGVTPMVVQPVSPDTPDTLLAQTRQTDKAMLRTLLSMVSMGIATVAVLAMIALVVSSDANHAPRSPAPLDQSSLCLHPLPHPASRRQKNSLQHRRIAFKLAKTNTLTALPLLNWIKRFRRSKSGAQNCGLNIPSFILTW